MPQDKKGHDAFRLEKLCFAAGICLLQHSQWPRGVTVSTLDSESSDRGLNPREASFYFVLAGGSCALRPCGVINGAENLVGAFVARCRNVVGAPPTVLRTLRCHRRMIERGVHNECS